MITIDNILETNRMITENKLDVRTITMGISLRDCAHPNIDQFCRRDITIAGLTFCELDALALIAVVFYHGIIVRIKVPD